MTRRQREVRDFVKAYIEGQGGIAPSYGDIAAALGLKSIATVHKHVTALVHLGWLTRIPNYPRSLEVPLTRRSVTAPFRRRQPAQVIIECENCAAMRQELFLAYKVIAELRANSYISK